MGDRLTLRGGLVVDGTGDDPFVANVVLDDARIVDIGPNVDPYGRILDVDGLVVAPGFIDIHSHYDAQVLWDPLLGLSTQFGFTTVVIGNCGFGVAPVSTPSDVDYLIQMLARTEGMSVDSLRKGLSWQWGSFSEYLDTLDRPLGPNLISLVPHSPLRYAVMGVGAYERAATSDELCAMQALLTGALEAGAWGFSSSTSPLHNDEEGRPVPSRLADPVEFDALAEAIAPFPFGVIGISPGSKFVGLSAEEQAIMTALSVRGGATVNWNPLVYDSSNPEIWRVNMLASEKATQAGASVFGLYNPARGMGSGGELFQLDNLYRFQSCPNWRPLVFGTSQERLRAFADPQSRKVLAGDFDNVAEIGFMAKSLRDLWGTLKVEEVFSEETRPYAGRSVREIASERGVSTMDVVLDIGVADDLRTVFVKMADSAPQENDLTRGANQTMAASPWAIAGGTDAGAHVDMGSNEGMVAKTIAWRVRDERSLTLAQAVRMFTSDVAAVIGLSDRGVLRPGAAGDLVVFDPEAIGAGTARIERDLPGGGARLITDAKGIHCTIVDGRPLVVDGHPTGDLPGRLLRSGSRA